MSLGSAEILVPLPVMLVHGDSRRFLIVGRLVAVGSVSGGGASSEASA